VHENYFGVELNAPLAARLPSARQKGLRPVDNK